MTDKKKQIDSKELTARPLQSGVMSSWIVAAQEPHPVGIEFIAYYGNGSKEKRISCLDGRDLAISLWLPLPKLPEA